MRGLNEEPERAEGAIMSNKTSKGNESVRVKTAEQTHQRLNGLVSKEE